MLKPQKASWIILGATYLLLIPVAYIVLRLMHYGRHV